MAEICDELLTARLHLKAYKNNFYMAERSIKHFIHKIQDEHNKNCFYMLNL